MWWWFYGLILFASTAAAQDWSRIFYEENGYCFLSSEFTRSGKGYLFGGRTVRVTVDNGHTWQDDSNWPFDNGAEHLVFFDSLQGIAVTGDYTYALTFDGGITWLERSTVGVPLGRPVYIDGNTLITTWLWTPNGFGSDLYVAFSLDSGFNWHVSYHEENLINGDAFDKLTSGGDGSVYATSFVYGLMRSYDLGATWTPVDVQPTNQVECLACPSPGAVLVTKRLSFEPSDSTFVARSDDNGATWTIVWSDSLNTNRPCEAAFVDSLCGWAAGDNGIILRTEDGGRTWQRDQLQMPQCSHLANIDFVSRSEGWLLYICYDWNPRWCACALYAFGDAQNDSPFQSAGVPIKHTLSAYPNPFNATVRIDYELPRADDVELTVHNTLGQNVASLFAGRAQAGTHSVNWSPDVASGVYFVKLASGDFFASRKVLYIR